jgi:hypothetical protein
MGIQNIVHANLYAAFTSFVTADFVNSVCRARTEGKDRALSPEIARAAKAFYAACAQALAGDAKARAAAGITASSLDARRPLALFTARSRRVARSIRDVKAQKLFSARLGLTEACAIALILEPLRHVTRPTLSREGLCSLIGYWTLDLKAADILYGLSMDGTAFLDRYSELRAIFLAVPERAGGGNKGVKRALRAAIATPEIRRMIGTHHWDGVEWFNKESAEDLAHQAAWAHALFSVPALGYRIPLAGALLRRIAAGKATGALRTVIKLTAASAYKRSELERLSGTT